MNAFDLQPTLQHTGVVSVSGEWSLHHSPDEEGITTSSSATILSVIDACITALMKKGLRLLQSGHFEDGGSLHHSPDEEGITTMAREAISAARAPASQP